MSIARQAFKGAVLALGAWAATANGALAGGEVVYGSGVRQAGAAVPVPAPAPIPDVSTGWYARIDAAYGQGDVKKYRSTDPRADQVRGDSYLDNYPRYGIGLGYYFNRYLRGDITVDQRNDVESRGRGAFNYTVPNTGPTGGTNPTIAMRDTYSDSFTSSNSTALANLYADLPMHPSFTPYLGAGIGFVRHQLKGRSFSRTTTCTDANVPGNLTPDCDPTLAGDQSTSTILNSTASTIAGGVNYQLAGALMAGFTYRMWENTKIDLGYRFLYLQGATFTGRSAGVVENLKMPDQNIHELRVGLRYDIN